MTLYINVHYIYYIIFNSYTYILYIYQILIPFYTFRYFFSDFQLAPWPVIGHPLFSWFAEHRHSQWTVDGWAPQRCGRGEGSQRWSLPRPPLRRASGTTPGWSGFRTGNFWIPDWIWKIHPASSSYWDTSSYWKSAWMDTLGPRLGTGGWGWSFKSMNLMEVSQ